MKINLFTDAPLHNLALMKISSYHRQAGDQVFYNVKQACDISYGSWLFKPLFDTDHAGGSAINPAVRLDWKFEICKPDYSLYPDLDYSLGYTWAYCPRNCPFCVVGKQHNPQQHHSIWEFHDPKFSKICLLNNNTFTDPAYLQTFEEIWDAGLTVVEHGFDVRLLDDQKAWVLKHTKFDKQIHFAWDRMRDEDIVISGLNVAKKFKLRAMVYVLMGFDTTQEENIYRCQKIHDLGFDPFPMLYNPTVELRHFRRMIYLRYYRKHSSIADAWAAYA